MEGFGVFLWFFFFCGWCSGSWSLMKRFWFFGGFFGWLVGGGGWGGISNQVYIRIHCVASGKHPYNLVFPIYCRKYGLFATKFKRNVRPIETFLTLELLWREQHSSYDINLFSWLKSELQTIWICWHSAIYYLNVLAYYISYNMFMFM